jgi:nicotinamidase/pyrazinamidase
MSLGWPRSGSFVISGAPTAEYDAATALLVVDVQNDFADPGGSLFVRGGEEVVPVIDGEIERARAGGALVVYTQDWHPEHTPHFRQDGGIWPVHCVGGTWGAEFHPGLEVVDGAEFVKKGTGGEDGYSAFSMRDPRSGEVGATVLESILRSRRIERVVIAGLATDYCVKESAVDATARGFAATVLTDAVRAVDLQPGDGERAFDAMRGAGVTLE